MKAENHFDLDVRPHRQRFQGDIKNFECLCHANFLTYSLLKAHIREESSKLRVKVLDLKSRSGELQEVTRYKCSCGKIYQQRLRFIQHMERKRHKPYDSNSLTAEQQVGKNVGGV